MTSCQRLFQSYTPSPGNHKVKVVDGSYSVVAGVGSIKINSTITLNSVLHIPSLSCNLISISKITKELNCVVNFSSSMCVFSGLDYGEEDWQC